MSEQGSIQIRSCHSCWIARSAENCNDYDCLCFNRKVDGIRKSAGQRAANAGAKILISERMSKDSMISSAKFFKKFKAKPWLLALIPTECGFGISLNRRLGFDYITLPFDFRARRSITSNAGFADEGF